MTYDLSKEQRKDKLHLKYTSLLMLSAKLALPNIYYIFHLVWHIPVASLVASDYRPWGATLKLIEEA